MGRTDSLEKTLMLGKIEGRRRRGWQRIGWHHRLNGHEFEQALGVGDGQGSLACCNPWGRKESDTTEPLNWTELRVKKRMVMMMVLIRSCRGVKEQGAWMREGRSWPEPAPCWCQWSDCCPSQGSLLSSCLSILLWKAFIRPFPCPQVLNLHKSLLSPYPHHPPLYPSPSPSLHYK